MAATTTHHSGRRIAYSRLVAVLFVAVLLVSMTGWDSLSPMVEHIFTLAGWVLVGVGALGRVWCAAYIGGRKTVALVTEGPYSMTRNPLYFFSFTGGLGVMFATETLFFPVVFCLLFAAYYRGVMAREEAVLLSRHGPVFEAYRARVPRFWPRFDLYREPETLAVSTVHLRKGLMDAIWFMAAGGFVELLEGIHAAHGLPIYFHVY